MSPDGPSVPAHTKVTRQDWLDAAMETLIADGVEQVKILPLSRALDVSRSSFYWYFESREDLLSALLEQWGKTNTAAIVGRTERPTKTIAEAVLAVFESFTNDALFDPKLDFAIREWARRSEEVLQTVHKADAERVLALTRMYARHGFPAREAETRARILYYMQIGYYALDLKESLELRLENVPEYIVCYTGTEATAEELQAFNSFARRQSR